MIQILMSTYNGENYLREQLDSLLNQTYENIKILIRDDGSKDGTIQILKEYSEKYPNKIECIFDENIGVIKSFFELMKKSDEKCNYFAFCDQDDFWLKEKVEKAIEQIKEEIPFLYCSNTILVDENLKILKINNEKKEIDLNNILVENCATGCTVVINNKLLKLLKEKKINLENVLMHDWWALIVSILFGEVYYDSESYIYYRQHGNNVVGSESNVLKKYLKKINNFKKKRKKNALKNQIEEMLKSYRNNMESITVEKLEEAIDNDSIVKRIKRFKTISLYRNNKFENLIFKFLYLCGWL